MRWELPREFLWAIIFTLAVFVVALWPLHYPYSQAPQINAEQQAKDGIGGGDGARHGPPSQENQGGQPQRQTAGEHVGETTILGIKPGEWLLGIVTWMLWYATFKLVRGAEQTAERQLRAYVLPEKVEATVMEIGRAPQFKIRLRNSGQTPAYQLVNNVRISIGPPDGLYIPLIWKEPLSKTTIAPNMKFFPIGGTPALRHLTQDTINGVREGRLAVCVEGETRYLDAFGNARTTRFRYLFNQQTGGVRVGRLMAAAEGNHAD